MTILRQREIALGPRDLEVTPRPDGAILVVSPHPLESYARAMPDKLVAWATQRPEQIYLAERTPGETGWRTLTYSEALRAVRALAQALLDFGCTPERGLAILSGNGIDHALLSLAAQFVGIPSAPISPAYALMSNDFAKLRHCVSLFDPALVFAADTDEFARALDSDAIDPALPLLASRGSHAGRQVTNIETLLRTTPTAAVDVANAALTSDTVAKILFTSGSTGMPKGVINTQRMLCSNQQMNVQAFPFWKERMVLLDWSPWNHTAGSNQTFNMVLHNGGTLYVDDGKPTPADFGKTLRNLHEISPTIYFNVPRGYAELARELDGDAQLRQTFFRELKMMWYAGAALAAPLFNHMRRLAVQECGEEVLMTTGLGSTETAPSALFANFFTEISGNVGVPMPGVEMKLVPTNGKLEMRVRGPSITPGYLHRADLTRAAFDDEGYYLMGDGLLPVDPADYSRGFLFDGRIGEDFKLATGTWVSVGVLRTSMIAELQPLIHDVVICGADRDFLTMLMIADHGNARRIAGDESLSDADTLAHPRVREHVAARLTAFAERNKGSSTRVVRAIFLDSPPSIEHGEITDKGSLNNSALRKRRGALIDHLYATVDHPLVIAIA